MFDCQQFRELIIQPVLSKLQVYSKDAEEILVFTCAAESLGGRFLKQVKGPALGVYQMEPATYRDIWVNYIYHQPIFCNTLSLHFNCVSIPDENRLTYDLWFATAMARIHYRRVKEALPKADDIDGLWAYYKRYYNTVAGKSKKETAVKKYQEFAKA